MFNGNADFPTQFPQGREWNEHPKVYFGDIAGIFWDLLFFLPRKVEVETTTFFFDEHNNLITSSRPSSCRIIKKPTLLI